MGDKSRDAGKTQPNMPQNTTRPEQKSAAKPNVRK